MKVSIRKRLENLYKSGYVGARDKTFSASAPLALKINYARAAKCVIIEQNRNTKILPDRRRYY